MPLIVNVSRGDCQSYNYILIYQSTILIEYKYKVNEKRLEKYLYPGIKGLI